MVVNTFGLKENGVLSVSPKVRDRIAAMAAASDDFQSAVAASIRTRFAYQVWKEKKKEIDKIGSNDEWGIKQLDVKLTTTHL